MLEPGGTLVVTVLAYRWPWSGHDVTLGHRRRYGAAALRALVASTGFTGTYLGFFNTLLLPAVAVARGWKRLRGNGGRDLARPPAVVHDALARVFALEAAIVPRCRLPFGASLVVVRRR